MYVVSFLKKCAVVFLSVTAVTSSVFLTSYLVKQNKVFTLSSDFSVDIDSKSEESTVLEPEETQVQKNNIEVSSEITSIPEQKAEKSVSTNSSLNTNQVKSKSAPSENEIQSPSTESLSSSSSATQISDSIIKLDLDSLKTEDLVQAAGLLSKLIDFMISN